MPFFDPADFYYVEWAVRIFMSLSSIFLTFAYLASRLRCVSSCSLFSVRMLMGFLRPYQLMFLRGIAFKLQWQEDGVRTVVVGGRKDIFQQYCGTMSAANQWTWCY